MAAPNVGFDATFETHRFHDRQRCSVCRRSCRSHVRSEAVDPPQYLGEQDSWEGHLRSTRGANLIPTPEPYSHGPCAVIAELRRLASESFEQNPAQAQLEEPPQAIAGCRSRCFRNWLLKPPPGPLGRGACVAVRARLRLSATAFGRRGRFCGRPGHAHLGTSLGLVGKGPARTQVSPLAVFRQGCR